MTKIETQSPPREGTLEQLFVDETAVVTFHNVRQPIPTMWEVNALIFDKDSREEESW